jgi:hypothetical protein
MSDHRNKEEELITLVETRRCLYDLKHAKYKDIIYKNNAWEFIGSSIGTTGNQITLK